MIGAFIGVLAGVAAALILNIHIPQAYSVYMGVAIVASIDSLVGALTAILSKKFDLKILITGIFTNAVVAVGLVYIGKLIGVELSFAAIVLFGARILKNFSIIRRFLLNKCEKKVTIDIGK